MNSFTFGRFISSRITSTKQKSFSRTASYIGIFTVTLGVTCMLIISLFLDGLQHSIASKIFNMNGHIHIKPFSYSFIKQGYISKNDIDTSSLIKSNPNILKIYPFLYSSALIKANSGAIGLIFKGIDLENNNYNKYDHLQPYIYQGRFFNSNDPINCIIIGKKIAKKLKVKAGQNILAFFFGNSPKYRKLKVIGIYKTNIPEIDENVGICNLSLLQSINKVSKQTNKTLNSREKEIHDHIMTSNTFKQDHNIISGYEIILKDLTKIKQTTSNIQQSLNQINKDKRLAAISISQQFKTLFDWLSILNQNKLILFVLIFIVICANISSIMFVQLLDKTYMTGVLMSLGASNSSIASIFIWNVFNMLFKGLILGNAIGLALCMLQHYFHFLKLDPDGVYLEYAIISWNPKIILFINSLIISVVVLVTTIFIKIILKAKPITSMEFR